MSTFNERVLSLTPGTRVELYTVDLTPFGGTILRFSPNREDYTPAKVLQLEDANGSGQARMHISLADAGISDGDVLVFEAFARHVSGNAFMGVGVSGSADAGASPDALCYYDLQGVDTFTLVRGSSYSAAKAEATQAGDFVYLSGSVQIDDATAPLNLVVEPASGDMVTDFGTAQSDAAVGSVLFFGLRIFKLVGGTRVPLLSAVNKDVLGSWVQENGLVASEAVNSHEAIKVPVWQGNAYTPVPIKAEGYERTGVGQFPRPVLSMSNITGAGSLLMQAYGDIRGAEVTRTRLFADNLDNGIEPDPLASFAPDIFILSRMSRQDSRAIQFELASRLDQQGVQLPARQVLRDICPWVYRSWDATAGGGSGAFVYADDTVGCPYTGVTYFDINGDQVFNPEDDKCSRKLTTGCRKRFGKQETLPLGSFPMVGRQRA